MSTAAVRTRPLFVYLLEVPALDGSVAASYIGLGSNPLRRTLCHNRLHGLGSSCKTTRLAAPKWRLRLVVGPFYRGARRFHDAWRHETRKLGPEQRLHVGWRQAQPYLTRGLRLWSPHPQRLRRRLRQVGERENEAAAVSVDPYVLCQPPPS
jgi:hypothetical protein